MSQNKTVGGFGFIITAIYGISTIFAESAGSTFLSSTKIFPILITVLTGILSIVIFMQDSIGKEAHKKLKVEPEVLKVMGKFTLIFVVYALIFEFAGYIVSTALMLMGLLTIMNDQKHKQNIIIALSFSIIAYFVFAKLLAISLPAGIIPL